MIDLSSLLHVLILILVVGGVCYLLWWFIGLPEPFSKIARVIVAVVAVLFLINLLLGFVGVAPLVRVR